MDQIFKFNIIIYKLIIEKVSMKNLTIDAPVEKIVKPPKGKSPLASGIRFFKNKMNARSNFVSVNCSPSNAAYLTNNPPSAGGSNGINLVA